MNPTIVSHVLYVVISVSLTVWVGRTLFKSGRIFILDSFHGNEAMADAVNQLLLVGFYLINLGFVALYLRYGTQAETGIEIIEFTSTKLGIVLLVLGGMHYFNMFNIAKMRRKARADKSATNAQVETTQSLAEMV